MSIGVIGAHISQWDMVLGQRGSINSIPVLLILGLSYDVDIMSVDSPKYHGFIS